MLTVKTLLEAFTKNIGKKHTQTHTHTPNQKYFWKSNKDKKRKIIFSIERLQ